MLCQCPITELCPHPLVFYFDLSFALFKKYNTWTHKNFWTLRYSAKMFITSKAGGMAQVWGLEFKPQYCKKKKKENVSKVIFLPIVVVSTWNTSTWETEARGLWVLSPAWDTQWDTVSKEPKTKVVNLTEIGMLLAMYNLQM
jgi:hypothetical protein